MRRDGAKCAWAGQVSQHAHKLVMEVTGLGPAAARTVAIQIQTHVTDTAVEIHKRARQTVRPAAPKPPAPSLYEQETQLDALDLLLTGSETISEYRRSHTMRRRNTVKKRMAACGEGVDYLPTVGTSVRTYTAGQCLQTTIKQYNNNRF